VAPRLRSEFFPGGSITSQRITGIDSLMADAVAIHMRANGVRSMGYIGFADAYGDSWLSEMKRSAQTAGIKIVAEEKYNRNDPSVTGQVLKILAAQPDAVAGPLRHQRPGADRPAIDAARHPTSIHLELPLDRALRQSLPIPPQPGRRTGIPRPTTRGNWFAMRGLLLRDTQPIPPRAR